MLASCPLDSLGFNRRRSDSGLEPPAEELHWFEDPCQLVRPCQAQEPCHVQGPYQDEGPFQAALGPILTAKSYRDGKPRCIPSFLPRLTGMGKLDLKEKSLFQLLFSRHSISTKQHSNVDHVVVVARHVVVVHPVDQVLT